MDQQKYKDCEKYKNTVRIKIRSKFQKNLTRVLYLFHSLMIEMNFCLFKLFYSFYQNFCILI